MFSFLQPPWTIAHQVHLSMGFSRQEYWSGLPCPSPGNLPEPGIEPASLMSPTLAGGFFTTSATSEAWYGIEIAENNRREKTRDLFKKIRDTKGTFYTKMGTIKDRNGMDLTEAEDIKKNYPKKVLMTQVTMMVWSLTWSQTPWNAKSSGP